MTQKFYFHISRTQIIDYAFTCHASLLCQMSRKCERNNLRNPPDPTSGHHSLYCTVHCTSTECILTICLQVYRWCELESVELRYRLHSLFDPTALPLRTVMTPLTRTLVLIPAFHCLQCVELWCKMSTAHCSAPHAAAL